MNVINVYNLFLLKCVHRPLDIRELKTTLNAFQTGKEIFTIKLIVLNLNQIGKLLKI